MSVTNESISKIQDTLTDLKVSSGNVEAMLDQLQTGFLKLEAAMDDMKNITSSQETRLQLLEVHCSRIPDRLSEDLALLKSQVKTYQRGVWLIATIVTGMILQAVLGPVL